MRIKGWILSHEVAKYLITMGEAHGMYNTTKSALGILPTGRIPSAERAGCFKPWASPTVIKITPYSWLTKQLFNPYRINN
jgi:hypothetical protein